MDQNIPEGAIPIDEFNASPPTSPQDPSAPEGAIPVDQFNAQAPAQNEAPPEGAIPIDEFESQTQAQPSEYESTGQQALTALEGVGQGLVGPVAPWLETKLGVDAKDIAGRAKANPWTHGIAEGATIAATMLTGVGEAGFIAKGAAKIVPESIPLLGKVFGKLGSAALKGMLETAAFQTSDELTKSLLGESDPETPVASALAHIGAAGLLGAVTGGMFNAVSQGTQRGLAAIENAKIGDKADYLLAGLGMAQKAHAEGIPEEQATKYIQEQLKGFGADKFVDDFAPGIKLYYRAINRPIDAATDLIAGKAVSAVAGPAAGLLTGAVAQKYIAPAMEKVLGRPMIGVSKYIMPTVLNALSKGQTRGLVNAMNYATKAAKGAKMVTNGVESLFKAGGQQLIDASDKDIQAVKDYIDDGGINQDLGTSPPLEPAGFAHGGHVEGQPDDGSIASLYPTQNMMLSAAKGRMSNYLTSLKPAQNPQKLPYDRETLTTAQEHVYNKAVKIAVAPLSIMEHIKDGSLQADHIKHINSMYPELVQHLQKKITKRLTQSQMDEEQPSGRTKQAMALFLGAPLETWMTPMGIMAAQATFLPKQTPQQGQQQGKTKKGTTNLGKSNKSYKTQEQAAEADRSERD